MSSSVYGRCEAMVPDTGPEMPAATPMLNPNCHVSMFLMYRTKRVGRELLKPYCSNMTCCSCR
jgi:hypothetical protein